MLLRNVDLDRRAKQLADLDQRLDGMKIALMRARYSALARFDVMDITAPLLGGVPFLIFHLVQIETIN